MSWREYHVTGIRRQHPSASALSAFLLPFFEIWGFQSSLLHHTLIRTCCHIGLCAVYPLRARNETSVTSTNSPLSVFDKAT